MHQGTSSVVSQICEKIMLCKRCKSFLNVCDYQNKKDILNIVFPSAPDPSENMFIDEGQVVSGGKRFLSRAYKRLSPRMSTIYEVSPTKEGYIFVDVINFRMSDGSIVADVEYLANRNISLLQFDESVFPTVPLSVLNVVKEQTFFFAASHCKVKDTILLSRLLNPCVVSRNFSSDVDESVLLVVPCASVCNYN